METKLLYQDNYINIVFEEQNHLLIDTWNEESKDLSSKDFKRLLLVFKEMIEESKAKYALTDVSRFMLPMTPELQEWTIHNVAVPLSQETNYSKQAFVMPKDFIANLSIEQFTEESNSNGISTRYFGDIEEAKAWLLEESLV